LEKLKINYWRCYVCNDIHIGGNTPNVCPTCGVKNAYVEIGQHEASKILSLEDNPNKINFSKEELIKKWELFCEGNDFCLSDNHKNTELIAEGVLNIESKKGFKYCPCRLPSGDLKKDLNLICPCNFKALDIWKEEGRCWCYLFVKNKKKD